MLKVTTAWRTFDEASKRKEAAAQQRLAVEDDRTRAHAELRKWLLIENPEEQADFIKWRERKLSGAAHELNEARRLIEQTLRKEIESLGERVASEAAVTRQVINEKLADQPELSQKVAAIHETIVVNKAADESTTVKRLLTAQEAIRLEWNASGDPVGKPGGVEGKKGSFKERAEARRHGATISRSVLYATLKTLRNPG